jgi:UDP-glucose 4-epimerase
MSFLALAARLAGRTSDLEKLTSNLQADNSKARSVLGWKPPLTFDEGLRAVQTGAFWKR